MVDDQIGLSGAAGIFVRAIETAAVDHAIDETLARQTLGNDCKGSLDPGDDSILITLQVSIGSRALIFKIETQIETQITIKGEFDSFGQMIGISACDRD